MNLSILKNQMIFPSINGKKANKKKKEKAWSINKIHRYYSPLYLI